ncbi:MAG: MoaD/ThiS family protein [Candidatus Aenigmarchaeota archaeon]|nr:MoaD/ThiS family protein [Candidatus Aenigmarchaeota archaeon]
MRVKVFLERENAHKSMEIPKDHTIESLLKRMKINPQTVIVVKNGDIVSEQESLKGNDSLKIIKVK